MEKFEKNTKHFKQGNGDLVISGIFTAIDEGNFALHFMLAFLGKASLSCQAKVVNKGQVILDEPFRAAATCSCFTNGRKQLKYDVQVIADQIVKKTVKLIKAIPK